ncbi:outer membrane protein assembly factor BamC [Methylomonas sp. LW13]|uniref:outer membrane protein assembly factor BamC n=1 Tax=unclassified Methylomonas TaxID=2608980 RepID=UPI00051B770A|nr:outer membrane protein assembly factor BamC [Methylomonas sp. LW13]QBC28023.1 outer membrane protein assembly factor BamC [Methylomonas sp. LW13]
MKTRLYGRLTLVSALLLNASCSTIKSWFPDKERDYQFTTEIPELVVPDDLKTKTLATRPVSNAPEPAPEPVRQEPVRSAAAAEPAPSKPEKTEAKETVAAAGSGKSVQAAGSSGVSSLQIDQSATQAWWIVGKALSRQKLEVVERNMDKGYFFVKYDPDAIKPEDGSILDEITFLFGDDPSQEQEYRVSLHQLDELLTEVTVQDSDGKTLSNVAATSLLRLITEGINQDIPSSTPNKSDGAADSAAAP